MLKPEIFVIGMLLSLSSQADGISYCPSFPAGAIARRQEEERREQEQIAQLNKLLNERIEQGKTIEITTDKNVKLLIKPKKMVDATVDDKSQSLTESVLGAIGIIVLFCLAFFGPTLIVRP